MPDSARDGLHIVVHRMPLFRTVRFCPLCGQHSLSATECTLSSHHDSAHDADGLGDASALAGGKAKVKKAVCTPTSAPGLTSLAIQLHTEMKFRAAEFEKYKFGAGGRGPHLPQDWAPSSTGPAAAHRVPLSFWCLAPQCAASLRVRGSRARKLRV